jgi:Integrase core domain
LSPYPTRQALASAPRYFTREHRRFRCTTDSRHSLAIKQNLLDRQFTMATPNRGWVTDITYLWTLEGWLYLAVIIDLFSRRVVGWSLSERLERGIALDALKMALQYRHPPQGLLHHSDRGSQYASHEYQQLLAVHGIQSSMSRKGNCWDNPWRKVLSPRSKSNWSIRASGVLELKPATTCSNISNSSTTASGGILPSATCLPMNSNTRRAGTR